MNRIILCVVLLGVGSRAAVAAPAFPLKPSADGRYLVDSRGEPFFYQADTPWMLLLDLDAAEAEAYLKDRQAKGFTALQIQLTGFIDRKNQAGESPFEGDYDFARPNERYFAHADAVIQRASEMGFLLAIAPLWSGCCGEGWAGEKDGKAKPLDANGVAKARDWGRWLGARYGKHQHIMWIMGGDHNPEGSHEAIDALARGIHEKAPEHLMTAHNAPDHSSAAFYDDEKTRLARATGCCCWRLPRPASKPAANVVADWNGILADPGHMLGARSLPQLTCEGDAAVLRDATLAMSQTSMNSESTTAPVEDADAYTSDKVKVLLKLATWYVRLRRPAKVERLLAMAIDIVENHGGMRDAGLNRVLDRYADDFRRLRRPVEAGRLADLAQRIRQSFPDQFYPDGVDTPWWLQEKFTSAAPSLPLEYHSSHAEDTVGWDGFSASAVAFVGIILITLVLTPLLAWMGGYFYLLWIVVPPIIGVIVHRQCASAVARRGAESWVRVTQDGVEYHDPQRHCYFRWPEIKHVWTSWESGHGEGPVYPSVVVVGRDDQFEMGSRFFTEQQVHWVNGLCKLHSGQKTFEDWRERPWSS